jgi:hypothetical protein
MGDALRSRWNKLTHQILAAYRCNDQSSLLNFYHNFYERTIRLRAAAPDKGWVRRTLSDEELRSGDLRAIAYATYEEARQ